MRRYSRTGAAAVLAVTLLLLHACEDQGPEGAPGTLTAVVVSPNGAEGAAWLELVGSGLGAVTAADGRAFSERRGDTVQVVVVREEAGELVFLVQVDDATLLPSAVLHEVADGDNQLRADLSGYRVEVRP